MKSRSPGPPPAWSHPDSSSFPLVSPPSGPQSSAQHRSVRELPALPGYFQPGGDLPERARAAGFSIPGVSAAPFLTQGKKLNLLGLFLLWSQERNTDLQGLLHCPFVFLIPERFPAVLTGSMQQQQCRCCLLCVFPFQQGKQNY